MNKLPAVSYFSAVIDRSQENKKSEVEKAVESASSRQAIGSGRTWLPPRSTALANERAYQPRLQIILVQAVGAGKQASRHVGRQHSMLGLEFVKALDHLSCCWNSGSHLWTGECAWTAFDHISKADARLLEASSCGPSIYALQCIQCWNFAAYR